jgi:hypothetical protein
MQSPPQRTARLNLAIAAALLPVVVFYAALFSQMRNVPLLDDYPVFLGFLLNLKQAPTLGSKLLLLLTTQHFEYKLIVPEAIAALQWSLTGHVNFSFLIVLGNLAPLGMLWLFWKNDLTSELNLTRRILLLLPIVYLLFSLNYAEALDLAEFGLQIGATIFFALASIHCLIRPGRRALILACLFALLACFSNANSFLLAPIGLLILLPRRKAPRFVVYLTAWIATFAAALAIYLYHYVPATMAADGAHVPLFQKLLFWLSFLGAATENMSRFPIKGLAIVVGALGLLLFAYACRTRFDRTHPFAFYTTLWCLLTAGMVAEGRSGTGLMLSLALRYKIYSDLLLIFCYVFIVSRFNTPATSPRRQRQLYATALVAAILLCTVSDIFGYRFLTNRQRRVEAGFNQYAADPAHNPPMVSLTDTPLPPQEPEACRHILNRAIAAGIYTLPPAAKR